MSSDAKRSGHACELAIAAVPYSSNLGDGVIHDIMIRILQQQCLDKPITTLDIAGRTRYAGMDSGERSRRQRGLGVVNALPASVRPCLIMAYAALLYVRKTRRAHAEALQDIDHLIIGGGHLLSDMDLNFPTKLFSLYLSLNKRGIPFSIYAVGASFNWSPLGRLLFRKLLRSPLLKGIAVRDAHSLAVVERELQAIGRKVPLQQVWDPAVATSLYYPRPPNRTGSVAAPLHVGVNIADIDLLTVAGDRNPGISDGLQFFRGLIDRLLALGYQVTLFTNGAEEDEQFLARLLQLEGVHYFRARRPLVPHDLIATLTSFDAVISHRLHAHIISYSYAIPTIGLGWDRKVSSFFAMTERAHCLIEADGAPGDITTRILDLLPHLGHGNPAASRQHALEARSQLSDFVNDVALAEPNSALTVQAN